MAFLFALFLTLWYNTQVEKKGKNMQRIYYNQKNITKLEEIACGTKAKIYMKDENTVIKIYRQNIENINTFTNAFLFANNPVLESANVILPKEKIYIEKELRGYTMDLVKGLTLAEIKINEKLKKQALKDLQTISEEGIVIRDITPFNIMYSEEEDKLKFIDIDHWHSKSQLSTIYFDVNGKINTTCVERVKLNDNDIQFLFDIEGNFISRDYILEIDNKIEIEKIKEKNKTMFKRILNNRKNN